MKVLVVGLGSMGKRRIRLMKQHFGIERICGVDISEHRRREATDIFGITTFPTLVEALHVSYDCAFVCSAPLSHSKIITQCLTAGLHVFSELNLIRDGYSENICLAKEVQKTLFISSTLLYREDIHFLIKNIQENAYSLSYTYHVGQYLPDWHPWEHYNEYFVAEKSTGGCRELFAIELPWLLRAFGDVSDVSVHTHCMSRLVLPYPDTYLAYIEHKNGAVGQLMVDVVARVPVRHFEVFGETMQLEWRGVPEEVWTVTCDYSSMQRAAVDNEPMRQNGYRDFIVEDAYVEEIRAFSDTIQGKHVPCYTFEDDLHTLQIVDEIMGVEY